MLIFVRFPIFFAPRLDSKVLAASQRENARERNIRYLLVEARDQSADLNT